MPLFTLIRLQNKSLYCWYFSYIKKNGGIPFREVTTTYCVYPRQGNTPSRRYHNCFYVYFANYIITDVNEELRASALEQVQVEFKQRNKQIK